MEGNNLELFQCVLECRLKAKFALVRVIDTLFHRKRVVIIYTVGLLVVAAAFTRSLRLHFMPLPVPSRTGSIALNPAGSVSDHVEAFPNDLSKLYAASCSYMSDIRLRSLASNCESDRADDGRLTVVFLQKRRNRVRLDCTVLE
jgi:hypothetical protein